MKYVSSLLALTLLSYSVSSTAANPYAEIREKLNATPKDKSSLIQPRIVGGQSATLDEYPFMAALVFVGEEIVTSLTVNSDVIDSDSFNFSPAGSASGTVVDCGLGGEVCTGVTDNICLIERGEFNFSDKALNCESGGGVGVIIYNNEEGQISGTLGEDFAGTIPVVAVTQADGQAIAALDSPTANLNVTTGGLSQDSTCGGTVIGDKWVLTAAHCVDDLTGEFLKVNTGEYDLTDGADLASDIVNIYSHPNYNAETFDNDVAILELAETVEAPPVLLADSATTNQLAIEGSVSTVIGWGGTVGYAPGEGPTSGFPDVLREVDINLLTNEQCSETYFGITDNMICAAVEQGGRSSCQGDSGGPLLVNTNTGWQQVGIVSWGVGCAAPGYPGVFSRVASLQDFISAVTSGVAMTGNTDLGSLPAGAQNTGSLTVTNNSASVVAPSFTVTGSSDFSVNSSNCATLAAGASCEVQVVFNSAQAGQKTANIALSVDVGDVTTNEIDVSANAIAAAASLDGVAGSSDNAITWFSGGALPWVENTIDGGVQSGAISDSEDSILMAQIEGPGTLSFQWSVSSEENTDEPEEPYDALYLFVNGEQRNFISGEVDFRTQSIELTGNENLIEWRYNKDINTSEGEDKAYVRSVSFAPVVVTPLPTPDDNDSGGGSMGWLLLLISGVSSLRVFRRFR